MIIPTRAHDYSLFIWEFGGFWGTAPLQQIFRVLQLEFWQLKKLVRF